MLAIAAFAALSASPLSWIAPLQALPPGCIARFGNPLAVSGSGLSRDGRFLGSHFDDWWDSQLVDTFTGRRYKLKDAGGEPLRGYKPTAAGYFVRWDNWRPHLPSNLGMDGEPEWRFALFDYATGKPKQLFQATEKSVGWMERFDVTPDGRYAVAVYWAGDPRRHYATLYTPDAPKGIVIAKDEGSQGVWFDPTGKVFYVSGRRAKRNYLDVFSTATAATVLRIDLGEQDLHWPSSTCLSADGRYLVIQASRLNVRMCDLKSGKCLWKSNAAEIDWVNEFRFTDDGKAVLASTGRGDYRWDATGGTGGKIETRFSDREPITSADRSTRLERRDNRLEVFDIKSNRVRFTAPADAAIWSLKADDRAAKIVQHQATHLWNWATGDRHRTTRRENEPSEDSTPDPRYRVNQAGEPWVLEDTVTQTETPIRFTTEKVRGNSGQEEDNPRQFTPDGDVPTVGPTGLVATDGTTRLNGETWREFVVVNPKSGRQLATYRLPPERGKTPGRWFHPNGREVWISAAQVEGYRAFGEQSAIVVLDLVTGTIKRTITCPGGVGEPWHIDRAGKILATGTCAVETQIGRLVFAHAVGRISALSPDGRWLLTEERRLYDLNRPDREPFRLPWQRRERERMVAFTPNGKRLLTVQDNDNVLVWDLDRVAAMIAKSPVRVAELTEPAWNRLYAEEASEAEVGIAELLKHPAEAIRRVKAIPVTAPVSDEELRAAFQAIKANKGGVKETESRLYDWGFDGSRDRVLKALKAARPDDLQALPEKGAKMIRILETSAENQEDDFRLQEFRLHYRAVELLERLGTPEAKAVLKTWAGGAPNARLTTEAKAALERLEK